MGTVISAGMATMNTVRSMFAGAALLALPADAQEHRFEDRLLNSLRATN